MMGEYLNATSYKKKSKENKNNKNDDDDDLKRY